MTKRAETGMIPAPRQIKQAEVKMIQTLNPGMESYRLKTGARQDRANVKEGTAEPRPLFLNYLRSYV